MYVFNPERSHIALGELSNKANFTIKEVLERTVTRNIDVFGWCKESSSHPIISPNAIANFLSGASEELHREYIVYFNSPPDHYIAESDLKCSPSSRVVGQNDEGIKYFIYKFSLSYAHVELEHNLYIKYSDSLKVIIPQRAYANKLFFDLDSKVLYYKSVPYFISEIQFRLLLFINNETRSSPTKLTTAKSIAAEFNRSLHNILFRGDVSNSKVRPLFDELIVVDRSGCRLSCYDNASCT